MILLQTKSNHPANKNAIPRQSYLLLLGSTAQQVHSTHRTIAKVAYVRGIELLTHVYAMGWNQ